LGRAPPDFHNAQAVAVREPFSRHERSKLTDAVPDESVETSPRIEGRCDRHDAGDECGHLRERSRQHCVRTFTRDGNPANEIEAQKVVRLVDERMTLGQRISDEVRRDALPGEKTNFQ
jgi:hypothetical protein